MNDLEELKKIFIVDKEEYEKEKIPTFLEKILKFCKVDKDGGIHFENAKLNNTEKIKLTLIARFLANKLDSKISPEVTLNELAEILAIGRNNVSARMAEILNQKIAHRSSKSNYAIYPYQINMTLEKLISKYTK